MDVGIYVSELLDQDKRVSLPGLGTFYKKRVSAYFDEKQGIFFPPTTEIAFEAIDSDSVQELIQHVCAVRNISEPSSRYFVEKFVDTINQSLAIKGFASIEPIGKLKKIEDKLLFEAERQDNHENNYGLSPIVEIKRKAKKVVEASEKPDFSAIRIKNSENENDKKKKVPNPTPSLTPQTEKEEKNGKGALWIVAIFLVLGAGIVAGYLLYPKFFKKKNEQEKVEAIIEKSEHLAKKDSNSIHTDSLKKLEASGDSLWENSLKQLSQEEGITVEKPRDTLSITTEAQPLRKEKNTTKDSLKIAKTTSTGNTSISFEVIVSTLYRKTDAERFISELRKKGIDGKVVIDEKTKKTRYLISIASLNNETAALNEKRRIEKELFKGAWIFKNKK